MASQIPEDFGSAFEMSDVVLHTLNSDGKELHANKSVLASYSPYFHAMFFKNFKEAKEKDIHLECDHAAMKEILRYIHLVNSNFYPKGPAIKAELMRNLYVTADMLDFPSIRTFCEAQMLNHASVDMANAAYSLGLHDIMMNIVMISGDVEKFISLSNMERIGQQPIFSKEDILRIADRISNESRVCIRQATKLCLNLEEISKQFEEPRIDLTQKWSMSGIALMTKNSQGRVLYINKAIVQIDAEYATVKQILSIVHHCNTKLMCNDYTLIHPVLLYDMYITASEEQLDIPMIKQFCYENLLQQKGKSIGKQEVTAAYDVAIKLGLDSIKTQLIDRMPKESVDNWAMNKNEALSYLRDGKEVVITAGDSREQMFSGRDASYVVYYLRHCRYR